MNWIGLVRPFSTKFNNTCSFVHSFVRWFVRLSVSRTDSTNSRCPFFFSRFSSHRIPVCLMSDQQRLDQCVLLYAYPSVFMFIFVFSQMFGMYCVWYVIVECNENDFSWVVSCFYDSLHSWVALSFVTWQKNYFCVVWAVIGIYFFKLFFFVGCFVWFGCMEVLYELLKKTRWIGWIVLIQNKANCCWFYAFLREKKRWIWWSWWSTEIFNHLLLPTPEVCP